MVIDDELMSCAFTENSKNAETHVDKFMRGLYDLFRSED